MYVCMCLCPCVGAKSHDGKQSEVIWGMLLPPRNIWLINSQLKIKHDSDNYDLWFPWSRLIKLNSYGEIRLCGCMNNIFI